MTKRCILDVDNTLWNLHQPLRKMLRAFYPAVPDTIQTEWDWYGAYGITDEAFYTAVDAIHKLQIGYPALPGAKELFAALNQYKYEIIVASHRRNGAAPALARWLGMQGLEPYSGIYTGPDKLPFIRAGDLVIDDAPDTIRYAHDLGCYVTYLSWAWNEDCPGYGRRSLFEVIGEVHRAVRRANEIRPH
mgnify:CR=1 FL=1